MKNLFFSFKVAVVMPNLDELLKDTPAHEFASVWFEWRKTKFYNTHYSELVRLAALYKYAFLFIYASLFWQMDSKFISSEFNDCLWAISWKFWLVSV